MPYSRVRTLSEVKTKDLYSYMDYGFYTYYDNDDFWKKDSEKRHRIVINQLRDIRDELIAIDKSPHMLDIGIYEIPEDLDLLYKLLYDGKVKISQRLLSDKRLDISKINVEHVYTHRPLDFNEDLLKYRDIMVYIIYSIDDVPGSLRAKELGIPIEIEIHNPDDRDSPPMGGYMEMIIALYNIGIKVSDDNVIGIIETVGHTTIECIISLLDMSYKLDNVKDLYLDVTDVATYNRVSRFMKPVCIIYYCLYSGQEVPEYILESDTIYDILLDDIYLIEQYFKRPDIMRITNPRYTYSLDTNIECDSHVLFHIYNKTRIRSMNHWIILLNDHDIIVKKNEIDAMYIKVPPVDIKLYRKGIERLWEQIYNIPKMVKYYLTNYRTLLPLLEPRIIPTKFYSYNGYANVRRDIVTSDVNITCV